MSMNDNRLKPNTTLPGTPSMSGSNNPPGSSGPRWRIRCSERLIAASVLLEPEPAASLSAAGSATNASSPHTAPQYAALWRPLGTPHRAGYEHDADWPVGS